MARIPWLEDPYHKCQTHCATWLLCSVYACHAWSFHVISQRGTHLTLALRNFVSASSVAVGLRRGCCGDASQEPVWVLYSMGFILFRKVVWAGISQMMKSSSPSLVVIPPNPSLSPFSSVEPSAYISVCCCVPCLPCLAIRASSTSQFCVVGVMALFST